LIDTHLQTFPKPVAPAMLHAAALDGASNKFGRFTGLQNWLRRMAVYARQEDKKKLYPDCEDEKEQGHEQAQDDQ